jgi:AsmA protein
MKKFIKRALLTVIVIIMGIVMLVKMVDFNKHKEFISAKAYEKTGLNLVINGKVELHFIPTISFHITNAYFSPTKEFRAAILSLSDLQLSIKLLPLLQKQVVVDKVELMKPKIFLVKDEKGHNNWELLHYFAKKTVTKTVDTQQKVAAHEEPSKSFYSDVHLLAKHINILDGTVSYNNKQEKKRIVLSKLNIKSSISPTGSPAELKFNASIDNKPKSSATLMVSDIMSLLDEKETHISLKYLSLDTKIDYSLEAYITKKQNQLTSKSFQLKSDKLAGVGNFALNWQKEVPNLTGSFNFENIDLNPYIETRESSPSVQQTGQVEQVLAKPTTQKPVNYEFLNKLNSSLKLKTKRLLFKNYEIYNLDLALAINNGHANLNVNRGEVFDGHINGKINLAANTNFAADLNLGNINANELLKNTVNFKYIEGIAGCNISINGHGTNRNEILSSLNGHGNVLISEGHLLETQDVSVKFFRNMEKRALEKIGFQNLKGSFKINNGVIYNDDLEVKTNLASIKGKGRISLPKNVIDYRIMPENMVNPKLVTPNLAILVEGDLNHPQYRLDLGSIINRELEKHPAVKKLDKQLKEIEDQGIPVKDISKQLKKLFK